MHIFSGTWVIPAISKHIIAKEILPRACEAIGVNEAADCRVIIAALEVVEARIGIAVIAAVAEEVDVCQGAGGGEDIAPGVVGVLRDLGEAAAVLVDRQDVALQIFDEIVLRPGSIAPIPQGNAADLAVFVEGVAHVVHFVVVSFMERFAQNLSVADEVFHPCAVRVHLFRPEAVLVIGIGSGFSAGGQAGQIPALAPAHGVALAVVVVQGIAAAVVGEAVAVHLGQQVLPAHDVHTDGVDMDYGIF